MGRGLERWGNLALAAFLAADRAAALAKKSCCVSPHMSQHLRHHNILQNKNHDESSWRSRQALKSVVVQPRCFE